MNKEQEAGRLASSGSYHGNQYQVGTNNVVTTLKDYGLTQMESSRAQQLAEHNIIKFKARVDNTYITKCKARSGKK